MRSGNFGTALNYTIVIVVNIYILTLIKKEVDFGFLKKIV